MLQILVKCPEKPDLCDELSVCLLLGFFFLKPKKNSAQCLDHKLETSFAELDIFQLALA